MSTFQLPPWQAQQPRGAFTPVMPSQSTALDLLSGGHLSFLAPELGCKSLDISQSLDISETRIPFPHGEIVLTQMRYTFTSRSVVERKK